MGTSLNEGVAEERTRHMDVIMLRRLRKIPLDHEGAHEFTHYYWSVMFDKNAFHHCRQKKFMGKMMAKVLIPFIFKNRVECLDES